MCQDKLQSLLLKFTEQELVCKLDFSDIIDNFKNWTPIKT